MRGRPQGNTKERFLIEGLRLFAERGYDAVKLSEIASAVGVSTPALYKHYPNKQALVDALLELSRQGFAAQMDKLKVDFRINPDKRKAFVTMPEEGQVKIMQELFLHTFEDEMPSLFRKFMTIEQFRHPEFGIQLNRRYVDSQFDAFETLMREFMDTGVYREGDARTMAVQYAAPVILYISVCDREPQRKDEAVKVIGEHVRQFNKMYGIEGETKKASAPQE